MYLSELYTECYESTSALKLRHFDMNSTFKIHNSALGPNYLAIVAFLVFWF